MTDPTRVLYEPNSRDTSRYTIPPFQRTEVLLKGDRLRGEFFPSIEGESIYIDRCDLGCTISLVTASGVFDFMARDGLEIKAPFRGIVVQHDNYEISAFYEQSAVPTLVFYTAKEGVISNSLNHPFVHFPSAYQRDQNSGVGGSIRYHIPVPAGARTLKKLILNELFSVDAVPTYSRSFLRFIANGDVTMTTPTITTAYKPFTPYNNHPAMGDMLIATGGDNPNAVMALQNASSQLYEVRFQYNDVALPNKCLEIDVFINVYPASIDLQIVGSGEGTAYSGALTQFA